MRYRKLDANYDYVFGQGGVNYFVNSPEAVAQAILTGMRLFQGEWFLDTTVGMPWFQEVIGFDLSLYDQAIQTQIRNTTGVRSIVSYSSNLDAATRNLEVQVTVDTIFSEVITLGFATPFPPTGGYGVFPYGTEGYGE